LQLIQFSKVFLSTLLINTMREEAEDWPKQSRADFKTAEDCFKDGNYYACAFFLPAGG